MRLNYKTDWKHNNGLETLVETDCKDIPVLFALALERIQSLERAIEEAEEKRQADVRGILMYHDALSQRVNWKRILWRRFKQWLKPSYSQKTISSSVSNTRNPEA